MEEKPTLKEYRKNCIGCYVKTADGRYFRTEKNRTTMMLKILSDVLFIIASVAVLMSDIPWSVGVAQDIMIVFLIFLIFRDDFLYPLERFQRIEEVPKEHEKEFQDDDFRINRLRTVTLILLSVFFGTLGSFSLAYLRSLPDTPGVSCNMDIGEISLEADANTELVIPDGEYGKIAVRVRITNTSALPVLNMDGNQFLPEYEDQRKPCWMAEDYFYQYVEYAIDAKDIEDGSVLTLSCGGWEKEWVLAAGET